MPESIEQTYWPELKKGDKLPNGCIFDPDAPVGTPDNPRRSYIGCIVDRGARYSPSLGLNIRNDAHEREVLNNLRKSGEDVCPAREAPIRPPRNEHEAKMKAKADAIVAKNKGGLPPKKGIPDA